MLLYSRSFLFTSVVKSLNSYLDNNLNLLSIWGLLKTRSIKFQRKKTCCQIFSLRHDVIPSILLSESISVKTMDPNYYRGYSQTSPSNFQQAFSGYGQYSNNSSFDLLTNYLSTFHLDTTNASARPSAASISPHYLYPSGIDPSLLFASEQLRSILIRPVHANPAIPAQPFLNGTSFPPPSDGRLEYSRNQLLSLAPAGPGFHLLPSPQQLSSNIALAYPRANQFLTPPDLQMMQALQTRNYSTYEYGGYFTGAAPAFQRNMHTINSPQFQRAALQPSQSRPKRTGPTILQLPRPVFDSYSQLREYCQSGSLFSSAHSHSKSAHLPPPPRTPPGVDITHVWAELTPEGRLGTRTPLTPPPANAGATPNPPKNARVEAHASESPAPGAGADTGAATGQESASVSEKHAFEFTLLTWNTLSPALAQGNIHLYDRYCEHEWLDYAKRGPLLIERVKQINADVRLFLLLRVQFV